VLVAVLAAGLGVWRGRTGDGARELVAGGRSGLGLGAGRLTRVLVVAQVALAALLLTGAGLFARSLANSSTVELGYRIDGQLGFELAPVRARFPDSASSKALAERVLERLQAQPGVLAAAAGTNLPIGAPLNYSLQLPGGEMFSVEFRGISPGFLDAFAIPLRAGRDVGADDRSGGAGVVLVNEAFVRTHLTSDPGAAGSLSAVLDRLLEVPDPDSGALLPLRIVGVVGDTRQHGPEAAAPPMVYLPLAQVPDGLLQLLRDFAPLRFAVRVQGDPASHAEAIRAAVGEVAPGQPIANLRPLADLVRESTDGTRLNLLLIGAFAALALLLSAVGLYAVVAVASSARQREFGVRSALGARAGGLLGLVLRDGLRQVALGLALGLVAALALSRVLEAFLAGTSASDPLVLLAVAGVLAVVALLACLLPALRAARANPITALRQD
jgi:predicted permease